MLVPEQQLVEAFGNAPSFYAAAMQVLLMVAMDEGIVGVMRRKMAIMATLDLIGLLEIYMRD